MSINGNNDFTDGVSGSVPTSTALLGIVAVDPPTDNDTPGDALPGVAALVEGIGLSVVSTDGFSTGVVVTGNAIGVGVGRNTGNDVIIGFVGYKNGDVVRGTTIGIRANGVGGGSAIVAPSPYDIISVSGNTMLPPLHQQSPAVELTVLETQTESLMAQLYHQRTLFPHTALTVPQHCIS